ncbi:MATE family efflux transporter [Vibrio sp.]|nr:MATE family efflux transporter [Vibrio sp.]
MTQPSQNQPSQSQSPQHQPPQDHSSQSPSCNTRTHNKALSKQLFNSTWPMLFGVLSLMSFQLVDSAFIGQLGILPLAVQGFTAPIQLIIVGLQVGLGIATTTIISRLLGAEKIQEAKQHSALIVVGGGVLIAVMGVFLYLIRHWALDLLGAPAEVYPIVDEYWIYWLFSAWSSAFLYFLYSICRANGNTMLPGSVMVITSLLNMILDPLFIFTFDMGLNGAAIASIAAFTIGTLIVAPKIIQQGWLSFDWKDIHIPKVLISISHVMGPAMTSQLMPPLSSLLATKLLATYGPAPVAAWAIGSRYEFFCIVTVLALTMSMPPMVGRMLGAGRFDDIKGVVKVASIFIVSSQIIIAAISFVGAHWLSNLMSKEADVQSILSLHFAIVPLSLAPLGICILMVSLSNAIGRSYQALLLSILRLFVFFIPCLWIGSQVAQIQGLLIGAAVGNTLAGITAWIMFHSQLNKLKRCNQA